MLQTTAHIRMASFMNCRCKLQGLDFHTSFQMDVWPAWIRCGCRISRISKSLQVCPTDFCCPQEFFTRQRCSVRAALLQPSNIFPHLPISSHIFQHLPTFQFHKTSSSPVGDGPPQPVVEAKRSLCYQYVVCIKAGLRRYSEVYEGNSGHVMIANREMSTLLQVSWLGPCSIRVPQHWLDFLDPWTFVFPAANKKHRVQSS